MINDRHIYRGKRADNGEWLYGCYFEEDGKEYIGIIDSGEYNGGKVTVIEEIFPSTLGQCTGLRDKNGTLIFEGDKLFDGIYEYEVKYLKYAGFVQIPSGHGDEYYAGLHNSEVREVIGNIHDNPKLLKGGK